MQPEAVVSEHSSPNIFHRIPQVWRSQLAALALCVLALALVAWREWGEMVHQWWNIDTYTHVLLVPVIIAWLVAQKLKELAKITPHAWWPGLLIVAAGLGLWLIGRASGINLLAHAGAVGAVQGAVIAVIGPRASLVLALPITFGVFLVPFGDEIIPPLQAVTADIAVALTHWSGIPAEVEGIYIDTPVGLFIVAEACSGVRFLVAMVTLAVLVAFTRFESWSRRSLFMLAAIIIPILANGVRAWGTIYIAQFRGVEFAAGFDHIFYGWIFFAIIVALLLAAAWRFFERGPQDFGWNAADVAAFPILPRLEAWSTNRIVVLAGIVALAIAFGILATIVAPAALG